MPTRRREVEGLGAAGWGRPASIWRHARCNDHPTMRSTLPFVLGTLLVTTTGCGDNIMPVAADLRHAEAAQLARAVDAASGNDALEAYQLAIELAGTLGPSDCPRVERIDDTTVITGCSSGEFAGRAVIEPPGGALGSGRGTMGRVTFEGFFDGYRTFDGVVERSADGAAMTVDLDVAVDGVTSTAFLSLTCDGVGLCSPADGSAVVIDDLGVIEVRGAWRQAPAGGYLTIVGAQTATFDLNAIVGGCIPYTLGGEAAGSVCQ
jgi:hypothetical protein